ncbi:hypothetical protein BHM03_00061720 [Ensete ventricosum]|nr:hypothetical protein BHM03_00061720 [Ensete ventricosum]
MARPSTRVADHDLARGWPVHDARKGGRLQGARNERPSVTSPQGAVANDQHARGGLRARATTPTTGVAAGGQGQPPPTQCRRGGKRG